MGRLQSVDCSRGNEISWPGLIVFRRCSYGFQPILRQPSRRLDIRHDLRPQGCITEVTDPQFNIDSDRTEYRAPHNAAAAASNTCQQTSNGSDVFEFVMKLTDDAGTAKPAGGLRRRGDSSRSAEKAFSVKRVCVRLRPSPVSWTLYLGRRRERQSTLRIVDGP